MAQTRLPVHVGWVIAIAAFFAPIVVVLTLSSLGFSEPVTPEVVEQIKPSDQSIQIFASLAQVMITMSVGIVAASLWLFRQPLKIGYRRVQSLLLCLSMLAALTTFYSGLRFLYETGVQLTLMPFEFGLLRSRLYWEGASLLAQVSILSFTAVVHHYFQDLRHDSGGHQ